MKPSKPKSWTVSYTHLDVYKRQFNNSAMDGFGVKINWIENATEDKPIFIPKNQTIAAGQIVD